MTPLGQLWDLLRQVRFLSFVASSGASTGWNGRGVGTVQVREVGDGAMTFHESGTWRPEGRRRDTRFSNVYRWTLAGDVLRLEHLRHGPDNPVHLFDLARIENGEWRPVSSHQCRDDCYSAVLVVRDDGVVLRWEVSGPRKRETIEYLYSLADTSEPGR